MKQVLYDTETTGAQPRFDQVLQAAAMLVDEDFKVLDQIDERCRLARHIVPHPMALKVTGVDPTEIDRAPHGPYEFSRMLLNTFSAWAKDGGAIFAGWNSIRFDEEILRQTLWENLHSPYVTNTGGASRADYLVMARALYARNPEALVFPVTAETGKPNFRLENLAPLNGFNDHAAHDALGDVRALAHVARAIRDIDPDLYHHMLAMGDARKAQDFVEGQVIVQTIGGSFLEPAAATLCLIGSETKNAKSKMAFNLGFDPEPYLGLSPEAIVGEIRKKGGAFRRIRCNQAPGIFPIGWGFTRRVQEIAEIGDAEIDRRAEMIRGARDFRRNVEAAMDSIVASYADPDTLEEKIYGGFPSYADKDRMKAFHATDDWERRLEIARSMESQTLRSLGIRATYVNAPDALPDSLRASCDAAIVESRLTLDQDRKWTTLGSFYAACAEMEDRDLAASYERWAAGRWGIDAETARTHREDKARRDAEAAAMEAERIAAEKADAKAAAKIAKEAEKIAKEAEKIAKEALRQAEKDAAKNGATGHGSESNSAPASAPRVSAAHFLDGIE